MNPGAMALTVMPFLASSMAADLGETDDPGLRRRVVGLAEVAVQPDHGADVDDPAVAGLDHVRQDSCGQVEDAPQVGLEDRHPTRPRDILANDRSRVIPALFTSTSILPKCSLTLATAVAMDDGSRTSQPMAYPWPPDAAIAAVTVLGQCLVVVADIVGVVGNGHAAAASEFESDLPADAAWIPRDQARRAPQLSHLGPP